MRSVRLLETRGNGNKVWLDSHEVETWGVVIGVDQGDMSMKRSRMGGRQFSMRATSLNPGAWRNETIRKKGRCGEQDTNTTEAVQGVV